MQACLYKPGFYQSVDFAVLFHPGHCLFLPADWATNRRVSWCVAIISASILNFVRTAIHFSPSSLFVILAACWWVPVICWVLFYKIKPLLLGFLLFSDDLGLHSQLCPCWNHFHPRHCYSFSFPNGFMSFLQFCSTKSNHYCGVSLYLAMIASSVLKFVHVAIHYHPPRRLFTSLPNGFLSFVDYWTAKSNHYCWGCCDRDRYLICLNPREYFVCDGKVYWLFCSWQVGM